METSMTKVYDINNKHKSIGFFDLETDTVDQQMRLADIDATRIEGIDAFKNIV